MAILGCVEKQKIEKEKRKSPQHFIPVEECLNSKDDQFLILGILAKYLLNIGIFPIIERAEKAKNEEEQSYANTLLQFIFNGCIFKNKYIIDFELQPKRVEQLYKDEKEGEKFNKFFKKAFAKEYNVKEEDLIVKEFQMNCRVYTIVLTFNNNFNTELTKKDLIEKFTKQKEFKQISRVKKTFIIEAIRLNKAMLDSRGDNKDDSNWGYNELRGEEPYYPPVGWHRYGLKVFDQYDNKNNDWLSYDNRKGEWCIAYSGLSSEIDKNYENDADIKHTGKKVGLGTYTTPFPKIMEEKTDIVNVNGINYKMGLMLRINPEMIRCPERDNEAWIINGSADERRPYGILIKKV